MLRHVSLSLRVQVTLASALACAGVMIPSVWFVATIGLALMLHALWYRMSDGRAAFGYGLLFGIATTAASIFWFWDTLPLDWIGFTSGAGQVIAIGGNWALDSCGLGLAVALAFWALWHVRPNLFAPVAAAIAWVIAEQGRMWSFSLLTWAPQSTLGAHFSVASLGYTYAQQAYLLQFAHPLGIAGLNAAIGFFAAVLALLPRAIAAQERRLFGLTAMAAAVLLIPLFLMHDASRPAPRTALLHTHIPPSLSPDNDLSQARGSFEATAADETVEVIVLPEDISLAQIYGGAPQAHAALARLFGTRDVLVLYSQYERTADAARDGGPGSYTLVYESTASGILGTYQKRLLMPYGEYVPSVTSFFYSFIDTEHTSYLTALSKAIAKGDSSVAIPFGDSVIGGLLCSDLHSPELYHELAAQEGATVFISLSNLSWFHESRLLFAKTLQIAKVHAVQDRVPFLAADNAAPAFALDAFGQVTGMSEWGTDGVLLSGETR